jgi:hypothetical protein
MFGAASVARPHRNSQVRHRVNLTGFKAGAHHPGIRASLNQSRGIASLTDGRICAGGESVKGYGFPTLISIEPPVSR